MKIKTILALLVFSCFMVHSNVCTAQRLVPVESLVDWNYEQGTWQFFENSATATINSGQNVNVSIGKDYEGCLGFQATIHISHLKDNVGCGIGKRAGYLGNDYLTANIRVGYWYLSDPGSEGFAPISCVLNRSNDTEWNIERYMDGFFGDWQYRLGQDITMALTRVGNEVWYYVEGYGTRKFEPPFDMEGTNYYNWFGVGTGPNGGEVTATIKDVYIIYPSETHQPLEITFSPNPVDPIQRPSDLFYELTYTVYNPNNYPVEVLRFGQFNECLTTMAECLYSSDDFVNWFTFCDQPSTVIAAKGTYCDQEWWVSRSYSASDETGNYAFWYKDNEGTTRVAISEPLTLRGLAQ